MKAKKKYFLSTMLLVLLLLLITIGYAYLSTNLSINGSNKINNASWDIHFENVQVTEGSVTASTPVINPNTTVTYSVNLSKPGDFYEFTVDVKNDGTIDAMIDTISSKLNNVEITTLPNYLNYSITYSDGAEILSKHKLNANQKETYKIRVEYKKDINASDMPTNEQNLNLSHSVAFVQKDDTAIDKPITQNVYFVPGNDIYDCVIKINDDITRKPKSCYNVSNPPNQNAYVIYKIEQNIVKEVYGCIKKSNVDICLRGGVGTTDPLFETVYESNLAIVNQYFTNCQQASNYLSCDDGNIYSNGYFIIWNMVNGMVSQRVKIETSGFAIIDG